MAFTVNDLQTFLHLLEAEPQLRTQLRGLLVIDAVQTLPDRFDRLTAVVEQLAQAQQRTEARLEQLAQAQQQTEARLEQLTQAQQRTEARLEQLTQAQQQTEARLAQLAQAQQQTEARLEQLAQAQQQTEARLAQLAQAQQQTEVMIQELVQAQRHTEVQVQALVVGLDRLDDRQRGEAGRREGERYERTIIRRAPVLFQGGEGGALDQPLVQQRLSELLSALPAADLLADDEDPSLADLLWWKGDQVAVIEVSLQVDSNDIIRAARRAATLQRAGAQAMGMVIGEGWAAADTRQRADARAVQCKVGDDLSDGFMTFRRLPI
jgi:HD-GYP domain-containing protein (c-di-GMP phosphodiesterase class II)